MSRRTKLAQAGSSQPVAAPRSTKVDPQVWRCAMKLAHGDTRRLLIVSATDVIVRNP